MDRQTDIYINSQIYGQTGRYRDRQTTRTDRQPGQADNQDRLTDRQIDRFRYRVIDRQIDKQT